MAFTKRGKAIKAARDGDVEALKAQLEAGASPNASDFDGDSLLWNAVTFGQEKTMLLLLEKGATVKDGLKYGSSLLHNAASSGNTVMAAALLERVPALLELRSGAGKTALHSAAEKGHADFVLDMIKRGIDPGEKDYDGRNALYYANREGHVEVVDILKAYSPALRHAAQTAVSAIAESAAPELPSDDWSLLGPQQVGRAVESAPLGYRLTDVFDFHARERIRIVHNTATQRDTLETVSFDALDERTPLKSAFAALQKQGGKADESSLRPRLGKAAKLKPPGGTEAS